MYDVVCLRCSAKGGRGHRIWLNWTFKSKETHTRSFWAEKAIFMCIIGKNRLYYHRTPTRIYDYVYGTKTLFIVEFLFKTCFHRNSVEGCVGNHSLQTDAHTRPKSHPQLLKASVTSKRTQIWINGHQNLRNVRWGSFSRCCCKKRRLEINAIDMMKNSWIHLMH